MPWRFDPTPYDYDYENGFEMPYRSRRRQDTALDHAKAGVRFYKAILNEEMRKAEKKKKEEKSKKNNEFQMPNIPLPVMVAIMLFSWPFIGMLERYLMSFSP